MSEPAPNEKKVIDIGDLSLWRKTDSRFIRAEKGQCPHRNLVADEEGEILECKQCGKQVSAYWAFMRFIREYENYTDSLKSRAEGVRIREEKGLTLKAAQLIEKAWRSRRMVPACPHCKKAILPTDGFGGLQYNKTDPDKAQKSFEKTMVILGGQP
jgi:ribosomal protein S27E